LSYRCRETTQAGLLGAGKTKTVPKKGCCRDVFGRLAPRAMSVPEVSAPASGVSALVVSASAHWSQNGALSRRFRTLGASRDVCARDLGVSFWCFHTGRSGVCGSVVPASAHRSPNGALSRRSRTFGASRNILTSPQWPCRRLRSGPKTSCRLDVLGRLTPRVISVSEVSAPASGVSALVVGTLVAPASALWSQNGALSRRFRTVGVSRDVRASGLGASFWRLRTGLIGAGKTPRLVL